MKNGGTTVVGGNGGSSGSGGGSADYAVEAGHAQTADEATHATSANYATSAGTAAEATHATNADNATNANYATSAGSANHANSAANLDNDSTDWSKIMRKDIAQTAAEVITFSKGLISTLVAKFRAGIKIGASDQYEIDANGDAALRDVAARDAGFSGDVAVGGDFNVNGSTQGKNATFENLTVTKEATKAAVMAAARNSRERIIDF